MSWDSYCQLWRVAFGGPSQRTRFVARIGILVVHFIFASGLAGVLRLVVSLAR